MDSLRRAKAMSERLEAYCTDPPADRWYTCDSHRDHPWGKVPADKDYAALFRVTADGRWYSEQFGYSFEYVTYKGWPVEKVWAGVFGPTYKPLELPGDPRLKPPTTCWQCGELIEYYDMMRGLTTAAGTLPCRECRERPKRWFGGRLDGSRLDHWKRRINAGKVEARNETKRTWFEDFSDHTPEWLTANATEWDRRPDLHGAQRIDVKQEPKHMLNDYRQREPQAGYGAFRDAMQQQESQAGLDGLGQRQAPPPTLDQMAELNRRTKQEKPTMDNSLACERCGVVLLEATFLQKLRAGKPSAVCFACFQKGEAHNAASQTQKGTVMDLKQFEIESNNALKESVEKVRAVHAEKTQRARSRHEAACAVVGAVFTRIPGILTRAGVFGSIGYALTILREWVHR